MNNNQYLYEEYSKEKYYHGTSADIEQFIPSSGRFGKGIYFFPDKDRAEAWASHSENGKVYTVELDISNPLIYNLESDNFAKFNIPYDRDEETRNGLLEKGYDSVKVYYYGELQEVVVLNSNQVRIVDVEKYNG